jgi:hypothetical protein
VVKKPIQQVRRSALWNAAEKRRLRKIRERFHNATKPRTSPQKPSTSGIAVQIRAAREAQGLSWYALAKLAGGYHPSTMRDLENDGDPKLSTIEAVARVLGLKLELVGVKKKRGPK